MKSTRRLALIGLPSVFAQLWATTTAGGKPPAQRDALARSREVYKSLDSYADVGIARGGGYRHTFRTFYRAPHLFYFEFNQDQKAGGSQLVLWCDGDEFQSWDSRSGQHAIHAFDAGIREGFARLAGKTNEVILFVPSLLFANCRLRDPPAAFVDDPSREEDYPGPVGTRRAECVTERHTTTLWIDVATALIRTIRLGLPPGMAAILDPDHWIELEPRANPRIEDRMFRFTVPSSGG